MRLDPLFDSFYVLGSLWGAFTGSQVCSTSSPTPAPVASTLAWAPKPALSAKVTAFVNVNVVPMDTERVLRNQTVLVEGGVIAALGPSSEVEVPAGAVRIDGRGKYLIPGLGDMHVHDLSVGDIRGNTREDMEHLAFGFLADGVTTIRHLAHDAEDRLSPMQLRLIRTGEIPSPRVHVPGFEIGSPSSVGIPHRNVRPDGKVYGPSNELLTQPERAATIVAEAQAAGYDFILVATTDVYARKAFPIVDSILAAAKRAGFKLAAHDHDRSFGRVMSLGTVGGAVEHLEWLRDTLGLPVENYSDPLEPRDVNAMLAKLPALAAATQRAGVWVTPTLNCLEMKYVMSSSQRTLLRKMVKALHDAGVGLLLSGDDGKNVQSELTMLVNAGLSPYQALLTGTRNVAQYFDILDSSGTVTPGKWADLLLLNGNPLSDIRHTRELAGVMIGGRWLDRESLDRGLLASPKTSRARSWIRRTVLYTGIHPLPSVEVQQPKLAVHVTKFEDLSDSLHMAMSQERKDKGAAERFRGSMVDELVAMRRILRPEQYGTFDVIARIWLRAQARQGHRMTVPGVAFSP